MHNVTKYLLKQLLFEITCSSRKLFSMLFLLANFYIVGKKILQFIWITDGNLTPSEILYPVFVDHIITELPAESANIAKEGRTHKTVSK